MAFAAVPDAAARKARPQGVRRVIRLGSALPAAQTTTCRVRSASTKQQTTKLVPTAVNTRMMENAMSRTIVHTAQIHPTVVLGEGVVLLRVFPLIQDAQNVILQVVAQQDVRWDHIMMRDLAVAITAQVEKRHQELEKRDQFQIVTVL